MLRMGRPSIAPGPSTSGDEYAACDIQLIAVSKQERDCDEASTGCE